MLIVDDESKVRKGLLKHIPWKELGIDIIQTAASGDEALSICKSFQPDLVLSDIRMNGMTGIEMCKQIRTYFPACQIIFISGYSDKEYLKNAIELGVVSYVEKPVDASALIQTLQKAVRECKRLEVQNRRDFSYTKSLPFIKNRFFLDWLIEGQMHENYENNPETFDFFCCSPKLRRICMIKSSQPITNFSKSEKYLRDIFNRNEIVISGSSGYWTFQDNRHIIILLNGNEESISRHGSTVKKLCNIVPLLKEGEWGKGVFLSFGKTVASIDELPKSYQTAKETLDAIFFKGYQKYTFFEKEQVQESFSMDIGLINTFSSYLQQKKQAEMEFFLHKLYSSLQKASISQKNDVKSLYFHLHYALFREYENLRMQALFSMPDEKKFSWEKIEKLDTLEAIHTHIYDCSFELMKSEEQGQKYSSAIAKTLRYIKKNFDNPHLSVKELADLVFLTPTYFSALFKNRMDKTVGQYLTEIRIEKSKEYLHDGELKLYHVAIKSGYTDANYFAKLFKKQTGMTPSEYRARYVFETDDSFL